MSTVVHKVSITYIELIMYMHCTWCAHGFDDSIYMLNHCSLPSCVLDEEWSKRPEFCGMLSVCVYHVACSIYCIMFDRPTKWNESYESYILLGMPLIDVRNYIYTWILMIYMSCCTLGNIQNLFQGFREEGLGRKQQGRQTLWCRGRHGAWQKMQRKPEASSHHGYACIRNQGWDYYLTAHSVMYIAGVLKWNTIIQILAFVISLIFYVYCVLVQPFVRVCMSSWGMWPQSICCIYFVC